MREHRLSPCFPRPNPGFPGMLWIITKTGASDGASAVQNHLMSKGSKFV